jgi:RNA 3'-terminal phosphate cyclase
MLRAQVLGSRELWFTPKRVRGGKFEAEIGTAGSIPMLIMTILPICLFADNAVNLHISKGGTDVSHSPTINYMRHVFFPVLSRMGVKAAITIHKYGYYPKGMGEVTLTVEPCRELKPLLMEKFGTLKSIKRSFSLYILS